MPNRTTVNLTAESREYLAKIQAETGKSQTQIINEALRIYAHRDEMWLHREDAKKVLSEVISEVVPGMIKLQTEEIAGFMKCNLDCKKCMAKCHTKNSDSD